MLDAEKIKSQFPILKRRINGKTLVYLDNAATSQKPQVVVDALTNYYENFNANIHRGIHTLSEEATTAYENCREAVKNFINANSTKEIIFTRNTTEAINLVAYTWGEANIKEGDEIIVSQLEHHSNLVPWQELTKRKNAKLLSIPLKSDLTLDMEEFKKLLSPRTKLVSVTAMSNVLGTLTPTKEICELAHKAGAKVLIDGAQSAAHSPTDVQDIDCDFFTISAHKMLGPTGVGVLYGKKELLEATAPFLFGGEMVKTVTQNDAEWNDLPWKFEAGTPNIADVIAFAKAIEFLEEIGMENIKKHDRELLDYAKSIFSKYENVTLHSPEDPEQCGSVLSFTIKGIHPHDIASIFNEEGIAIRSGQHCAEPLLKSLNLNATARMSFYIYNTTKDIDRAETALKKVIEIFA